MALPPGPSEPAPLQLARWLRDPLRVLDDCSRRFGDAFTFRFPKMPPFVLFSHPTAIKEIFTADPEYARAGEANEVLRSIVGANSLLLLDGERHLRERKLMMPPFHGERMRQYGDVMREATAARMRSWEPGKPFTIHAETQAITLEVILRAVFGLEGERLTAMRALLTHFTEVGTSPLGTLMLLVTPAAYAEKVFNLGIDPIEIGGRAFDVSRLMPWSEITKAGRAVDAAIYAELARRRSELHAASRVDILSMLLAARDEHGNAMTDVELRDEMITLLLAGHETTATTLAWTVHFILSNPDVHARVVSELRAVTGGAPLKVDDAAKLEWLDATIKESMRLMPIINLVGRRLKAPHTLGGYDLPTGTGAVACIHLTHRRPELYPDPTRFDPARFVGQKPSPYEFFPFGGGTRRCIGMAFATYEMRIVLAELFARATLREIDGKDVEPVRRGITLAPKGGVKVVMMEGARA
jgi:cytochrome P450